jgi:hypothetical protein
MDKLRNENLVVENWMLLVVVVVVLVVVTCNWNFLLKMYFLWRTICATYVIVPT